MYGAKNTLAEFMEGAKTLIENAAADPAVAATLAGFGYDAARLAEGHRLWEEAEAYSRKMTSDRAEMRGAAKDFEVAWAAANAAYIKTLKVARVAFGDDVRAITALKLYGPRKQSTAGWLEQAHGFYAGLSSDRRFAQALAHFGYDDAKLAAETALIAEVRNRSQVQVQSNGASQSATAARDAKFRELDVWVSDFRTICRVAFYENPQELEKLGVMVLN
ncbi:MAG TPA: hypothetical protein VMV83_16965 [Rectinemataceae bacterium]|nr:hypothetical protein [Rectinemataceae bacterium]